MGAPKRSPRRAPRDDPNDSSYLGTVLGFSISQPHGVALVGEPAEADTQTSINTVYAAYYLPDEVVAGCAPDDEEGAGLMPPAHTPSGRAPRARWQGDRLRLRRLRLPEPDDRPGGAGAAARHSVEIGRSAGDLPFCQARVHPRTV